MVGSAHAVLPSKHFPQKATISISPVIITDVILLSKWTALQLSIRTKRHMLLYTVDSVSQQFQKNSLVDKYLISRGDFFSVVGLIDC